MKDVHNNGEHGSTEDSILKAVRELPQSIEPRRDLWPQIARQLDTGDTRRPALQIRWTFALAAALGCMALGALLTIGLMKRGGTTPATTLVSQANAPAETAPGSSVRVSVATQCSGPSTSRRVPP